MERCCGCRKSIWPWQKTGFNSSWHEVCTLVWQKGYDCRRSYDNDMCWRAGQPTIDELWERHKESAMS